jgi:hypothetical protein
MLTNYRSGPLQGPDGGGLYGPEGRGPKWKVYLPLSRLGRNGLTLASRSSHL